MHPDASFLHDDELLHSVLVKHACDYIRVVMHAEEIVPPATTASGPAAGSARCRPRPSSPAEFTQEYLHYHLGCAQKDSAAWVDGLGPVVSGPSHPDVIPAGRFLTTDAALTTLWMGSKQSLQHARERAKHSRSFAESDPVASAVTSASSVTLPPHASPAPSDASSAISLVSELQQTLLVDDLSGFLSSEVAFRIVGPRNDLAPWLCALARLLLTPGAAGAPPTRIAIPAQVRPFKELADSLSALLLRHSSEAAASTLKRASRVRATINGAIAAERLAALEEVITFGLQLMLNPC